MRNLLATSLIVLTLSVIVSYPTNAVFYLILLELPHEIIVTFLIVLTIAALCIKGKTMNTGIVKVISYFGVGSIFVCFASFVVTKNTVAIRDAMSIAVLTLFVIKIEQNIYIRVLRTYIFVNSIFLALSITLLTLYYIGIFDLYFWDVSKLEYINSSNPAVIRDDPYSYSYRMPYYLLVIPFLPLNEQEVVIFAVKYLRQPLLYTEPAYTWLYTLGILFFSFGDKKMPYRRFILLVLGIALLVSFSVQGVASMIVGMFLIYIFYNFKLIRAHYILFSLLTLILVLGGIYFDLHEYIIFNISSSKYDQYSALKDTFAIFEIVKMAPLLGTDELIGPEVYGSAAIIFRYGLIGFGLLVLIWIWIIKCALKFMSLNNIPLTMLFLPASVIVTVFISFRVPQMNQLLPILLLVGTNHLYYQYPRDGLKNPRKSGS